MTEPDVELLKALVTCLDSAETHEMQLIYLSMIKKLIGVY